MYAREVGEQVLSFGVSGMLLRDGFVMYDRETGSLWTQVNGQAISGRLAPATLTMVPALHVTWKEWRRLYPASQVLRKLGIRRSSYRRYNRSSTDLGIMGRRNVDTRLPGKAWVIGIHRKGNATVFPQDEVREAGVVEAEVGDLPVVLAATSPDAPVVAFDRRIDGRTLSFELEARDESIRDSETGSRWRLVDGVATEGPLAGQQLTRVVANAAFWFGWQGYFPHSEVWRRATGP